MASKKNVAICLEHRFYLCNGKLYTKLSFPYEYWKDYLIFFDKVVIVGRVKKVDELEKNMARVDGPNVNYELLPYFIGPTQFLFKLPILLVKLLLISFKYSKFILRSGNISNIIWIFLFFFNKSYLREYPGNIKEGIIGFAGNSYFIIFVANILHIYGLLQGKFSKANSFVSHYCMRLYSSEKPSYVFSSFRADEITGRKPSYSIKNSTVNIASLGRLENEKNHVLLLRSIKNIDTSYKIKIHLIGCGSNRNILESYARKNNLQLFLYGAITDRNLIFSILSHSDIFVIPSLTDGMPRALLEAMIIGLPCLGTRVGGIPEILQNDCMCSPGDEIGLARIIERFIHSKVDRRKAGLRNTEFIKRNFNTNDLSKTKKSFWCKLYD